MLEAEQSALDRFNKRRAKPPRYTLVRLSLAHPSAHIVAGESRYSVCGVLLYRGVSPGGDGARFLCQRCGQWLAKHTRGMEA